MNNPKDGRSLPNIDIGDLSNKVALITGASSGLGRQIAMSFAAAGAYVVSADLRRDPPVVSSVSKLPGRYVGLDHTISTVDLINQAARSSSESTPARATHVHCDVSSADSFRDAVSATVEAYGRLDIMVNNAGLNAFTKTDAFMKGSPGTLHEVDDSVLDKDYTINVRGTWLGIKYAAIQMLKQEPHSSGDRGWIINMSSTCGIIADPGIASYNTSKAACLMLTKAAALDYAPHRIHVNAIAPGFMDTPLLDAFLLKQSGGDSEKASTALAALAAPYPWGRIGMPEEVAKMAVFLAGPGAAFCTGQAYVVDGGLTAK